MNWKMSGRIAKFLEKTYLTKQKMQILEQN